MKENFFYSANNILILLNEIWFIIFLILFKALFLEDDTNREIETEISLKSF